MASADSATFSDIKRAGSGFSFTGNMAKLAVNGEWVGGYEAAANPDLKPSDYTSMWTAISSGTETVGNDFYITIRNYIDDIGNIDTCGIDGLLNFADILGLKSDYVNRNTKFPIEIQKLVEIFSVNPAYLYNKSTDGSQDTLTLSNSILHYTTVERFLSSLKDKDLYEALINDVFYNTLMEFLNLKTTTFDDSINGNVQTEIWKTDTNRFLNRLWNDDITSDEEVYALKERLGIDKSFTEKIYADDIMSGKRKLSDFSDIEQTVIKVEMKNRETRYGDSNAMRYYYMRLFKVVEYFRFATIAYSNAYKLERYGLNENQYTVDAFDASKFSLLKFNYSEYEIDASAVKKVAAWLTNICFGIRSMREDMKTQCRKNMMVGTKRLIVDLIRKFILEKIDAQVFGDLRSSILYSAGLNKKFGVSVIEYSDMTEYFNIESPGDSVKPSEYNLNGRYWEMYDDVGNAFDDSDVLSFYNRLFKDSKKFVKNSAEGVQDESNLYEFLSILFESGAVSNTNSDYYLSSDVYALNGGSEVEYKGTYELSDIERERLAKNSADMTFAEKPYVNHKNTFHPSYQLHPFIQAFEEYNEAYTSVMNLVNSYTENINESYSRLKERIDSLGNTINFWFNWNDDFSGYSSTYEKSGSDYDSKLKQEGPFNFEALQEFLSYPSEYVNNILNGLNKYYYDVTTGKPLLSSDEIRLEVGRLQKYATQISLLSKREIYKYGKDYNGNIYILYKDAGNRNNRAALGDVWVRLRNHPLAFPLFDLSLSPIRFGEMSCLTESDNTKLVSVLTKIFKRFNSSYGLHYRDDRITDGDVVSESLTVSIGTYSETVPVTISGSASSYAFTYGEMPELKYGNFRLVNFDNVTVEDFIYDNSATTKVVYEVTDVAAISSMHETFYYRDSVTNEDIPADNISTTSVFYREGSTDVAAPNPTGKIVGLTGKSFLTATYDDVNSTIAIEPVFTHASKRVVFADYEDENSFDGRYYYCYNSVTGETHPCTRRSIKLNRIFALPYDAFKGDVLENGNVMFGGRLPSQPDDIKGDTPFSDYSMSTNVQSGYDVIDGGRVYEDFNSYRYTVVKGGASVVVNNSEIVLLAGCNPFHMTEDGHGKLILEKAYVDRTGTRYSNTIKFSDDIYRTNVGVPETLSSVPFSACEFIASSRGVYSDSIGQFYLRGRPYERYYPYTSVLGVPVDDKSKLIEGLPYGTVTINAGDEGRRTFYYNIAEARGNAYASVVNIKQVRSDTFTQTIELTSCKLGGSVELLPYDKVEYPISLNFTVADCDNMAVYSSFMSEISQQKFFDMGFSYNQKLLYLSYKDDRDGDYLKGGTIVGKMDESYDGNYSPILVFHRDSSHNVEFVDAKTSFLSGSDEVIHIGDISSKRGIFTVYGKYYNGDDKKYMEVALTLFSTNDVRTWKFGIDVKNGLFDGFDDGGSKYSFALSCTNDRLYLSCTINPPGENDEISTTINGRTGGLLGTTMFGQVKSSFADCMIQIASFDITDDEIRYMPSETRYVLGGGEIGYFQQFGGMSGKSNIFANGRLATDTAFPVQPQFPELTAEFDINLLHEYGSTIDGFSGNRRIRNFDRYINLTPYTNPSFDEVTGFLVEDDHRHAMLSVAVSGSMSGRSVEFGSIGDRSIIDISRGLDGGGYVGMVETYGELSTIETSSLNDGCIYMVLKRTEVSGSTSGFPSDSLFSYVQSSDTWEYVDSKPNHGVNVISDGSNTSNRCAAFMDGATASNAKVVNGKKMVLIPIHSDVDGYARVDFDELVDNGDRIFSKHSDGNTISILSVRSSDGGFNPTSGICEYNFTPKSVVDTYSQLPSEAVNGTIIKVSKGDSSHADGTIYRYDSSIGEWSECESAQLSKRDVEVVSMSSPSISSDGYTESATIGGRTCYGVVNGSVGTWFGAFGDSTTIQTAVRQLFNNGLYGGVAFSVNGNPSFFQPEGVDLSDSDNPYVRYRGYTIVKNENEYAIKSLSEQYGSDSDTIDLHIGETIVSMADTAVPTIKMFNTSFGYVYKYDVTTGVKSVSHIFDEVFSNTSTFFNSVMSEGQNSILVSYWSDTDNFSGVLRTRKNTPDSVGTKSIFKDIDGNVIDVEPIVKFLSVNNTMLAEERGGFRIFRSIDDGVTFVQTEYVDDVMHLVGCGTNRFYARYGNGEKVYSTDGVHWTNTKDIHASKWSVVNASGVDYLMCDEYDSDLRDGLLERSKYVLIETQLSIGDGIHYDKMCIGADGAIVCVAGMDGESTLKLARFQKTDGGYGAVEHIEYPYVDNMAFNNAYVVDDALLLSPNGGMNAIRLTHIFGSVEKSSAEFIDISSAVNNEVNIFGGFGKANGRIIMYPSDGASILVYDTVNSRFHNIYSFDEVMTLCDCDSITFDSDSDVILSPRTSTIDGKIKFTRTGFSDRLDYGIIEIDEGFPIVVGYNKITLHKLNSNDVAESFKISFLMMNDKNHRTVSVMSKCSNYSNPSSIDYFDGIAESAKTSDCIYVLGDRSMKYSFSSVDDTSKFIIRREFPDYAAEPHMSDALVIDLVNPSDGVNGIEYDGIGRLWVYGDIHESNDYSMELDSTL